MDSNKKFNGFLKAYFVIFIIFTIIEFLDFFIIIGSDLIKNVSFGLFWTFVSIFFPLALIILSIIAIIICIKNKNHFLVLVVPIIFLLSFIITFIIGDVNDVIFGVIEPLFELLFSIFVLLRFSKL